MTFHVLVDGCGQALVCQLLDQFLTVGRPFSDTPGKKSCPVHRRARIDDFEHVADPLRLIGVDHLARQRQAQGILQTDDAREQPGSRSGIWNKTPVNEIPRKPSIRRCDPQIALGRELGPHPNCWTVDHTDRRLRTLHKRPPLVCFLRSSTQSALLTRNRRQIGQIGPCTERSGYSCHYEHGYIWIVSSLCDESREVGQHRERHRVLFLGAIDDDGSDPLISRVRDEVAHEAYARHTGSRRIPPTDTTLGETVSDQQTSALQRLRKLNIVFGALFVIQAIVLLIVAEAAKLPVRGSFLTDAPGSGQYGSRDVFDLRVDWVVAIFLLLAAIDHLGVASIFRRKYEGGIVKGVNPFRWWEYSISASLMVVLIAMLAGVSELTALVMMFGANAGMIFFGLVMEKVNVDVRPVRWSPFVYGCVVGIVPWIGIVIQFWLSSGEGDGVPGFVYVIFVTLFLLFNGFAVNMWLAYRGKGKFANPLFTEKVYLVLSIAAKSALAWQVYGGSLAGA